MRERAVPSRLRSWAIAACAALALGAASGMAQPGAEIDLGPVASHVAQQEAATVDGATPVDAAAPDAWAALARKLGRPDRAGLVSDLGKLALVAKQRQGTLSADAALPGLLGAALDAADSVLAGRPDEMTFHLSQIKLQKARNKVLAVVADARQFHDDGRLARGAGDEAATIAAWTKSEKAFARAVALARSLIKKQGGGVGQF